MIVESGMQVQRKGVEMVSPKNFKPVVVIALAVMFFSDIPVVSGAEMEKVVFKDHLIVEDTLFTKRGAGLFRYLGLIKAYAGALYVEEGTPTADVLSNTAKRLEIEYFRNIKGEDFGPATNKLLALNVDSETLARLQDRIEKHNALYVDVQPGDRYSLTFIPGKGTELALNGKTKGVIEGDDFASAIYAIWFGRKPISNSFKDQLMELP